VTPSGTGGLAAARSWSTIRAMDFSFRFDLWLALLRRSPRDAGSVELCVLRTAKGERKVVERLALTPERGIEGDRWLTDPHRREGNQVSLMNAHVLRSLAGAEPARQALAGDNLIVDLDLSEANLPVGTRLHVGACVLEITPDPHRPCRLFEARYGVGAVKRVNRGNARGLRARGVLARCVRGGAIARGDRIDVHRPVADESRPATAAGRAR